MSIIPYQIEQEEFMDLNKKLESLLMRLRFWIGLILDFVFKAHYAHRGPMFLPNR